MTRDILLILVGAMATGLLQIGVGVTDRRREAEAILTAIASEVDSICRLIQHQKYNETFGKVAADVLNGKWDETVYVIDIRENYFSVYEGIATKLGMLRPTDATKIVNFYAYCKSAIDSTRPDGVNADSKSPEAAANMVSVSVLLSSILNLGKQIIVLPKIPIHDYAGMPEPVSPAADS